MRLFEGVRVHEGVEFYVSTSRHVAEQVESQGWLPCYRTAGVQILVDTCTYVTPILRRTTGVVMTNSAKWAYYAPGNLGVEVAFGSLEECVRSAIEELTEPRSATPASSSTSARPSNSRARPRHGANGRRLTSDTQRRESC